MCALLFEEFQVMQDLPHHRFRLVLDFFNQYVLHAREFGILQN